MNSRHSFVNIDWLSTYMSVCVCVCVLMLVFWEPNRLSFPLWFLPLWCSGRSSMSFVFLFDVSTAHLKRARPQISHIPSERPNSALTSPTQLFFYNTLVNNSHLKSFKYMVERENTESREQDVSPKAIK